MYENNIKNMSKEELAIILKEISGKYVDLISGINKNLTIEDARSIPILGEVEVLKQDDDKENYPEGTYIVTSYYTFSSSEEIGENKISVAVRPDNSICIRKDTSSLLSDFKVHKSANQNECIYELTDITEVNLDGHPSLANGYISKYKTYEEYINEEREINNIGDINENKKIYMIKDNDYLDALSKGYREVADELNNRLKDEFLIRLCIGR